MSDLPAYMSLETLASVLDVGGTTIEGWVAQGKFPAPRRIGPNGMRRWRWKDVENHIEGRQNGPADLTAIRRTGGARSESWTATKMRLSHGNVLTAERGERDENNG